MSDRKVKIGISIAASGMFLVVCKVSSSYYIGVDTFLDVSTMPETLALNFKLMKYHNKSDNFLANRERSLRGDYTMNSTYDHRKYWYNTKNLNLE